MIQKIEENYRLMVENYQEKHKSDHWVGRYKASKLGEKKFIDYQNFRKPKLFGNNLSTGFNDEFGFISTMNMLIDLLYSKSDIDVKEFSEVKIGNPKFYNFGDFSTTYNELRIIKIFNELNKYIDSNTDIICEIGGGYGSLASKIKKKYLKKTLILIDLPETLIIQSYYLTTMFPNLKYCFYENFKKLSFNEIKNKKFDFIFIPPWEKNKLIGQNYIDLFINSVSFQEMDQNVILEYFDFIQKSISSNGIFYNLNKNEKIINKVPIRISEYPYDKYWKIIDRKVDSHNPNLHQVITKRVQNENHSFYEEIKVIPKINPSKFKWSPQNFVKITVRYILNILMFFFPKKILYKLFKIYF